MREGGMTGEELMLLFAGIFHSERLEQLARDYGLVERQRALDVVGLVLSLILCGGTHEGGRQYDVLRTYIENGSKKIGRGAFYAWFNDPLERLLQTLLDDAIRAGMQTPCILPGILRGVSDWCVVDSSTIKLDKALLSEWPGTGDYAALKIHKEWSVGHGNLIAFHLSPAREHDSPHLVVDESRRGTGLLVSDQAIGQATEHILSA